MKRRKVLVIAPLFFGYYKDIVEEFKAMGYEADYICDAPSNSNLSKAMGRVNKSLIHRSTETFFSRSVLPIIKQKTYDLIFLVAGMTFAFSVDMMKCLKKLQKEARYVMYQWDSEVNLPFVRSIHPLFDRVYTFDRFDSLYKPGYLFLPLFYNHSYENIGKGLQEKNIGMIAHILGQHIHRNTKESMRCPRRLKISGRISLFIIICRPD